MTALPGKGVRMAGADPATKALIAATLLGGNAVGIASLVDLAAGSANGLNSGEIPLNLLLSMAPGAGALAGMVPAALASPAAMMTVHAAASKGDTRRMSLDDFKAVREAAMKFAKANPSLSAAELAQKARVRGGRLLAGSALAGSLAAGIPALLAMRDQPGQQAQA